MNKYHSIEGFYKQDMGTLLREWYLQKKMSSCEIAEKITRETKVLFSDKQLRRWLNKLRICRTQAESMRNRVITQRMDYEKRKPMKNRFIDYKKRDYEKRGELWAVNLRDYMTATLYNNRSLAAEIGCDENMVSYWKNKRHKISKHYQQKILEVFRVFPSDIFSAQKGGEIPRLGQGSSWNVRGRLIGLGWRNFQEDIKTILYKQTEKTVYDIAKAMKLETTWPSVSNAFNNKKLVSPKQQIVIARIFEMPAARLFVEPDMTVLTAVDESDKLTQKTCRLKTAAINHTN